MTLVALYLAVFVLFNTGSLILVYQALLDLYAVLRNPNQGMLAGHMSTPVYLHFCESVTFALIDQQDSIPRPMYSSGIN